MESHHDFSDCLIQKRATARPVKALDAKSPEPDEAAVAVLERFLDRLTPRERQALFRFYVEGQSEKEIEDAPGVDASELRRLRFKAKAAFASAVGQ